MPTRGRCGGERMTRARERAMKTHGLIKACERHWKRALWLLDQMRDEGIKPGVFSYTEAILARKW